METLVERATRLGVETATVSEMLDAIESARSATGELAMLTKRLAQALRKAAPDNELPAQALDYMSRTRIDGSPYRKVGDGCTATVTRAMLTAAHGVTLESGDVVLSARLLERIYTAMAAAEKTHNVELRGAEPIGEASLSNAGFGVSADPEKGR